MEGYSHAEIAGALGVTESTSRWHLAEAKQRLRRMLGNKAKLVSA
jgi:RNA polymerase sigma-70 factor (ECF subfamily)